MSDILKIVDWLREFLENELKDIVLKVHPESGEENRAPKVIAGYNPREELEELIPCVIIGNEKGKNTISNKTANITISVAIYESDTVEAYKTLYNLLDRTTEPIINQGIILEKYEVLTEYAWELSDNGSYPFWGAKIEFSIVLPCDYRTDVDNLIE